MVICYSTSKRIKLHICLFAYARAGGPWSTLLADLLWGQVRGILFTARVWASILSCLASAQRMCELLREGGLHWNTDEKSCLNAHQRGHFRLLGSFFSLSTPFWLRVICGGSNPQVPLRPLSSTGFMAPAKQSRGAQQPSHSSGVPLRSGT